MVPSRLPGADTQHDAISNSIGLSEIMGTSMPALHETAYLELPVPVWPKAQAQVSQHLLATDLAGEQELGAPGMANAATADAWRYCFAAVLDVSGELL